MKYAVEMGSDAHQVSERLLEAFISGSGGGEQIHRQRGGYFFFFKIRKLG
jgi:hypothetical protein